jgi:hypothetical protein
MDQTIGKLWEHHSKIGSEINIGSESQGIYDPINCCADSNVSLCEMMRRLSRTLYVLKPIQFRALLWSNYL